MTTSPANRLEIWSLLAQTREEEISPIMSGSLAFVGKTEPNVRHARRADKSRTESRGESRPSSDDAEEGEISGFRAGGSRDDG